MTMRIGIAIQCTHHLHNLALDLCGPGKESGIAEIRLDELRMSRNSNRVRICTHRTQNVFVRCIFALQIVQYRFNGFFVHSVSVHIRPRLFGEGHINFSWDKVNGIKPPIIAGVIA